MVKSPTRALTLEEFLKLPETKPANENGDVANVFTTYPDWTIEILSPDQSPTKVTGNILHCLNNGSKLVWLLNP